MTPSPKTKALQNIEARMEALDPASLRYQVLECARDFKKSWIELGRHLFTVYRDKLYKEWGYLTFEAYSAKEIGVRQQTAVKMLRSYSFLEREEPAFVKMESLAEKEPGHIPGFETINALRLAKESQKLPSRIYNELRDEVLDGGREDAELKKKIRYVLKTAAPNKGTIDRAPTDKQREIGKILTSLRQIRQRFGELEFPAKVMKNIEALIDSLEELQR